MTHRVRFRSWLASWADAYGAPPWVMCRLGRHGYALIVAGRCTGCGKQLRRRTA